MKVCLLTHWTPLMQWISYIQRWNRLVSCCFHLPVLGTEPKPTHMLIKRAILLHSKPHRLASHMHLGNTPKGVWHLIQKTPTYIYGMTSKYSLSSALKTRLNFIVFPFSHSNTRICGNSTFRKIALILVLSGNVVKVT